MTREARLRPEYAHLYPGIEPGTWEAAADLAERVLVCRLLLPSNGFALGVRTLGGGHFEFRGGRGPRLARPLRLAQDPRAAGAIEAGIGAVLA
jgi:hypothetical protein